MTQHYDALLALSCGINKNGELINDARISVETAARAWNEELAPLIIMSGRVSYKADFEPPISEAQAMKDYAVSLGVPASKILTEVESKDTLGNALFTRLNLLGPLALQRVLIVPGPNHSVERLEYIFKKVFGHAIAYDFTEFNRDRRQEREREQKSLQILKDWLDEVSDGDIEAIYDVILRKHLGYTVDVDACNNLKK